MALTNEEFELFRRHFIRYRKDPNCPFCGGDTWALSGPYAALNYQTSQMGPQVGPGALAVVIAKCRNCSLMLQFSWPEVQATAAADAAEAKDGEHKLSTDAYLRRVGQLLAQQQQPKKGGR